MFDDLVSKVKTKIGKKNSSEDEEYEDEYEEGTEVLEAGDKTEVTDEFDESTTKVEVDPNEFEESTEYTEVIDDGEEYEEEYEDEEDEEDEDEDEEGLSNLDKIKRKFKKVKLNRTVLIRILVILTIILYGLDEYFHFITPDENAVSESKTKEIKNEPIKELEAEKKFDEIKKEESRFEDLSAGAKDENKMEEVVNIKDDIKVEKEFDKILDDNELIELEPKKSQVKDIKEEDEIDQIKTPTEVEESIVGEMPDQSTSAVEPTQKDLSNTLLQNIKEQTTIENKEASEETGLKNLVNSLENKVNEDKKDNYKPYIINYNDFGRGLVYNCKDKHWACVNKDNFLKCKHNQILNKKKGATLECAVKNVYRNNQDCRKIQTYYVNTLESTDFCN